MKTLRAWLLALYILLNYSKPSEETFTGDELYNEIRGYVRTFRGRVRFRTHETKCIGRYNQTRDATYCFCDENCELYGDCCYDYWINNDFKTLSHARRDTSLACMSDVAYNHTRLYWYAEPTRIPRIRGHVRTITCPDDADPEHAQNCLAPNPNDTLGKIPVEGPDNRTYRNIYCARCNGHAEKDITSWRYELLCDLSKICSNISSGSNGNFSAALVTSCLRGEPNCTKDANQCIHDKCTWYYVPPWEASKQESLCFPVKTCPRDHPANINTSTYQELTLKCNAYSLVVHSGGKFYKNFHCLFCYGLELADITMPPALIEIPTLSVFFEIPKPKWKTVVRTVTGNTNETNATTLQQNTTMASQDSKTLPGEKIITFVGLAFSILGLALLLVLYSMVKTLRTTPGKIIIGLSASVLAYHVVLIASPHFTDQAVACSVVAIILHVTILSAFAWMGVMSFDVWKTFGQQSHLSVVKSKSTFHFYCLYVAAKPALLVGTAVILDQTNAMTVYWRSDDIDSSTSCWILGYTPHLIFFLIPVGLTLLFNIVALLWTVFGISRVKMETRRLNEDKRNETTNNIKMYAKLSVVMGISWVLGFTIEYSDVMKYIYVLVNSFQGFLIFLAFVVNKRVYEKFKHSRQLPSKNGTGWTSGPRSNGLDTRNKNVSGTNTGVPNLAF